MPITESRYPASVNVVAALHTDCARSGAYVHDGTPPRYARAVVAVAPPQYRSICSGCGDTTWLGAAYPKVEYTPIAAVDMEAPLAAST